MAGQHQEAEPGPCSDPVPRTPAFSARELSLAPTDSEILNKSGERRSDGSPTTMRAEGWGDLHRDTANTPHPEGFCSLSPLYLGEVAGTCPVQKAWRF